MSDDEQELGLDGELQLYDYVTPDGWSAPRHAAVASGHNAAVTRIYRAFTSDGASRFELIAEACKDLVRDIFASCPPCWQRKTALMAVQMGRMQANFRAQHLWGPAPDGTPTACSEAWLTCLLQARMWASAGIAAEQRRRNSEVTDG